MKNKRTMNLILTAVLLAVLTAGCTSGISTATPAPSVSAPTAAPAAAATVAPTAVPTVAPATAAAAAAPVPAATANPVSEVPIEVRVFFVANTIEDMDTEIQSFIEERSNVKFIWELAPSNSAAEVFALTLASNDMPDVMIYNYKELMKYALNGAFTPLNDLAEQYAPNFMEVLNDDQIRKDLTNSDGKIYTFPMIAAISAQNTMLIRDDWLQKLGLPDPTTRDEWLTVLRAFRDNDLNGDGSQIIPFTIRNDKLNTNLNFYESFGIDSTFFIDNGKVNFGPADPRFKDYLEYMNILYSEKLLDPEYVTNDANAWQVRMSTGVSGACYDFNHQGGKINATVGDTIPGFHIKPILPPKTDDGKVETRKQMEKIRSAGAAISSTSKYKEELVKFYDYPYTPEGRVVFVMGLEGKHWVYDENGEATYIPEIWERLKTETLSTIFEGVGVNRDWPMVQHMIYEIQSVPQEVTDFRVKLHEVILPPYPVVKFTVEEQRSLNEKMTEISTYVSEMWDKYIMGLEPLTTFDTYLSTLEDMGIQEMIAIHQAAVDRYNSN